MHGNYSTFTKPIYALSANETRAARSASGAVWQASWVSADAVDEAVEATGKKAQRRG